MKIFGMKEKDPNFSSTGVGGGTTRANVYDYIDSLWVKLNTFSDFCTSQEASGMSHLKCYGKEQKINRGGGALSAPPPPPTRRVRRGKG